jgi:hypothetical protein
MKKILLSVFLLVIIYANAITINNKSVVVNNTADFIKAVAKNSPYNTVIVDGTINNLSNVLMKDNLQIIGVNNSKLVQGSPRCPANHLLIVSKNDSIGNLTLQVDDYNGGYAITNNDGASVGNLVITNIISNGEININIQDSSTDSNVNVNNVNIQLNNQPSYFSNTPAAINLVAQNHSILNVHKVDSNQIVTVGGQDMGIFVGGYTNGQVNLGEIANNMIVTNGKAAMNLYLYATESGSINVNKAIANNNITVKDIANGIFIFANNYGTIKLNNGIIGTVINNYGPYNNSAIAFQAENFGKLVINGLITNNNLAIWQLSNNNGIFNCVGECDTLAQIPYSGIIDFSHAELINNNIVAHIDDTPAIINVARGVDSMINFGFGSESMVNPILSKTNDLVTQESYPAVITNTLDNAIIR